MNLSKEKRKDGISVPPLSLNHLQSLLEVLVHFTCLSQMHQGQW